MVSRIGRCGRFLFRSALFVYYLWMILSFAAYVIARWLLVEESKLEVEEGEEGDGT